MNPPWENDDGSTNTQGFLEAYKADDNVFWRADVGHIQNVLDDLIYRLEGFEKIRVFLNHAGRGESVHLAVQRVANAILEEGPFPEWHRQMMRLHRDQWPTLWTALDELVHAATGRVPLRK